MVQRERMKPGSDFIQASDFKSNFMKNNQTRWVVLTIQLSILSLVLMGCDKVSHKPAQTKQLNYSNDAVVTNNLAEIWSLLQDAGGNSDRLPKSFI